MTTLMRETFLLFSFFLSVCHCWHSAGGCEHVFWHNFLQSNIYSHSNPSHSIASSIPPFPSLSLGLFLSHPGDSALQQIKSWVLKVCALWAHWPGFPLRGCLPAIPSEAPIISQYSQSFAKVRISWTPAFYVLYALIYFCLFSLFFECTRPRDSWFIDLNSFYFSFHQMLNVFSYF